MNNFENAIEEYIGHERLAKIQNIKIGIAGAGGLGSNCAFNLARVGFVNFFIVDFDIVEPSNLNRQFFFLDQVGKYKVIALKENLLRINPKININVGVKKICEENVGDIFQDCDVIVEAFDQVKYKKLIIETYLPTDKLVVAASGLAGWGDSDLIKVNKIANNFYLIGDLTTSVSKEKPPMSPKVNIVAAKQADVILEWTIKTL